MILMIFSGLLGALSFPPLPFFFLAWVMFIPWFIAIEQGKRKFVYGFVSGLIYHSFTLYWIAANSALQTWAAATTAVMAILYLSIWWGLIFRSVSYQYSNVGRPAFLQIPLMMALVEFITSFWDIGFPWVSLGVTQLSFPASGLFASLGVFGATIWIGTMNFCIYLAIRRRKWRLLSLSTILVLLVLPFAGDALNERLLKPGSDSLSVAVIQPDLDPLEKWSAPCDSVMELNLALLRQARLQGARLVVFPETAAPLYLNRSARWRQAFQQIASNHKVTIAVGALSSRFMKEHRQRFNSMFFFDANRHNLRYDKQLLVPFGERFPFQRWLPSLGSINLGQAEFAPGYRKPVVSLLDSTLTVAPSICFESIFQHQQIANVLEGADLLINITNDGWYRNTLEPAQHFAQSCIRSIECGRPLVRAANNGISAVLDGRGNTIARLPVNQQDILYCTVPLLEGDTLFMSWGRYLIRLTLLVEALYLLMFYGSVSWRRKVSKNKNVLY
jgi:apolipoprotein N-acyltransferase